MLIEGFQENRQHGTREFPLAYYLVDSSHPRYKMTHHWHSEAEFIYIRKGKFLLSLEGREYVVSEGELCYIPEGALHGGIPQDCVYECICFNSHILLSHFNMIRSHLKSSDSISIFIQPIFNRTHPQILKCAGRLLKAVRSKDPGWELLVLAGLYDFYGTVIQQNYRDASTDHLSSQRLKQIKLALEYIEENFSKHVTLEQLADVSGLSPKYFCRHFRNILQKTPIDYLNYYRVEQACFLLEENKLSITDIAYACGYNDSSYFVRCFKKYKGITPNQYAKLSKFQQING